MTSLQGPYDDAYDPWPVDDDPECQYGPDCPACDAKAMGLLTGQGRSLESTLGSERNGGLALLALGLLILGFALVRGCA